MSTRTKAPTPTASPRGVFREKHHARKAFAGGTALHKQVAWQGNFGFRGNGEVRLSGGATVATCRAKRLNREDLDNCDADKYPAHIRDATKVVLSGTSTFTGGDVEMGEGATLEVASGASLTMADDSDGASARILAAPLLATIRAE